MIEGAGVHPDPLRTEGPRVADGARQQVLAQPAAELGRDDAEVGDLHGIVVGYAAELVKARECAVPRGHVELDVRIHEVLGNLVVGPVPAVAPVKRLAHRAIAVAVQLGGRDGDVR